MAQSEPKPHFDRELVAGLEIGLLQTIPTQPDRAEQFCKEDKSKLAMFRNISLIETYQHRLYALIASKSESTEH